LHDPTTTGVVTVLVGVGVLAVAIWLGIALARGFFWTVSAKLLPEERCAQSRRVAVVIPARNEAGSIDETIESLLRQDVIGPLHIFLVDDDSSDGTGDLARAAATLLGGPDRLDVLQSRPLPKGWTGKLWAVSQGVAVAMAWEPDFLLLTDADISHAPDNVSRLIAVAERHGYDLTSLMVKLHCSHVAERLLIPAFVYFFLLLYPPARIRSRRSKVAGAAGGCMLLRPAALERMGGIERIRVEIIDDCALARGIKRSGGTVWLGLTPSTSSHRAYQGFAEIEKMISRTAFNQLQHSTILLAGTVFGLICTYLAPPGLFVVGVTTAHPWVAGLGGAAWLLMALTYLPMVRFYALNPAWAFTLPLAAVFYLAATVHSAWKHWTGRGGEWKGRAQDRSG
jgi:hopene-associated glycosyltransferase HpnB